MRLLRSPAPHAHPKEPSMPSQVGFDHRIRCNTDETREIGTKADILLVRRIDRRNLIGREALLQRITREFHESPGLCLTALQASRLFGLPEDTCARVLDE